MQADLQDRLKLARDQLRAFLESLHVQAQPGRFRVAPSGVTPAGARLGLVPSCLALRTARILGLWERVDPGDRELWLRHIRDFQRTDPLHGEPACEGAFLDPEALGAWQASGGRLRRLAQRAGLGRHPGLRDLALRSTRTAIGALLLADALPDAPYRAIPHTPRALGATLARLTWRDATESAALAGDLCMLVAAQTPHFLELTEIRALKSLCTRHLESVADAGTGGYFRGSTPRYGALLAATARVLEALIWLDDQPPHHAERLIDTCLAGRPSVDRRQADIDDWARVLHHCARHTSYRRAEVRDAVPDVLELVLAHRESDGGWADRPGVSRRMDGEVEVTHGVPAGDLYGTARMAGATAMLVQLLGGNDSGWAVPRI